MSTPLRELHIEGAGGSVIPLPGAFTPVVDARVRALRRLLKLSAEVASWDPQLVPDAESDRDALEVEPGASNLLRSLELSPDSSVLHLGAGTGQLTRYLAETVALVDALEPNTLLAELASERLRTLPSARVFAGTISDVPESSAYDIIVAIDALRGGGEAAVSLLAEATKRLAPDGTIVLAETNRLGVKFLVGAPEDESGIVFDGIEGYPTGASHAALSRSELDGILAQSELVSSVLLAFPHHKEVRSLVDPRQLDETVARLAIDLAPTPSPDVIGLRPKLADESSVWREAVEAGLAEQLANSFVVVSTRGPSSSLWPAGRVASFHSWRRSPEFTAHTIIEKSAGQLQVRREYPHVDSGSPLLMLDSTKPFVPGRPLTDLMKGFDDDRRREVLAAWRSLVHELAQSDRVWVDVHPGNIVVDNDGSLTPIDLEFGSLDADVDQVIRRGILTMGRSLALRAAPSAWPSSLKTLGDVVNHLGSLIGYGANSDWLQRTIDDEALFQQLIAGVRGKHRTVADWRAELLAVVDTPLVNLPLGERAFDAVDRLVSERDAALERLGTFDARIRELEAHESALTDHNGLLLAGVADRDAQIAHWNRRSKNLSTHVKSLEEELSLHRKEAAELEITLRNEIHHRYLAMLDLEATRPVRLARAVRAAQARFVRAFRGN